MVDALFEGFDVTVKHRARASTPHPMPGSMNVEPFLGRFFAAANLLADFGVENFRAATGNRTETVFAEKLEAVRDRHFKNSFREMANFDRRESFDVEIWIKRT